MLKFTRTYLLSVIVALFTLAGCQSAEKAEQVQADDVAAQMMGRRTAKPIVNTSPADTIAIKEGFKKAKIISDKYKKEGHQDFAAAFDSSFYSTIRRIAPEALYLDHDSRMVK